MGADDHILVPQPGITPRQDRPHIDPHGGLLSANLFGTRNLLQVALLGKQGLQPQLAKRRDQVLPRLPFSLGRSPTFEFGGGQGVDMPLQAVDLGPC